MNTDFKLSLFVGFVHGDFKLINTDSSQLMLNTVAFLVESVVLYGGYILPVFCSIRWGRMLLLLMVPNDWP
ncbi:hypothetical protein DERF_009873 [Dermatophagoides farinae]|uniref:Uncharacterized protein n=1 Tax=Dermatophagoides farinae TaxID=6954 RepID=A0A922HXS4_DERFA|nr:hypothetical protein DERF_009873 [Dermatophagoides farinae]